jgi:hypothetical protein
MSFFREPTPIARYTGSVPSGGELSSRERSRSFGIVKGGGVVGGVEVGIRRVERIVIGESG